ncbi:hypothetical protein DZK34_01470 [Chlamydia abortus]|nr:hypothetical protein DZK34_01470 [Chlamydia abortus]
MANVCFDALGEHVTLRNSETLDKELSEFLSSLTYSLLGKISVALFAFFPRSRSACMTQN